MKRQARLSDFYNPRYAEDQVVPDVPTNSDNTLNQITPTFIDQVVPTMPNQSITLSAPSINLDLLDIGHAVEKLRKDERLTNDEKLDFATNAFLPPSEFNCSFMESKQGDRTVKNYLQREHLTKGDEVAFSYSPLLMEYFVEFIIF